MADKNSKGYDPTQARMVGNIIAGLPGYFTLDKEGRDNLREKIIKETSKVIESLRLNFVEDRK